MMRRSSDQAATAWAILLALTFARMTMGFQFQSIPALGFALTGEGGMSFAALGALTGAYLVAGIVVALAGGWLGKTIGDARVALLGLVLMTLGGLGAGVFKDYTLQLAFRTLAGVGAVGLNVMATKMAADWFEGDANLTTAMGVLVSSWPGGIALGALVLPWVAEAAGLATALLLPAFVCGAGLLVLALVWREPHRAGRTARPFKAGLSSAEWTLVVLAGLIWGTYNVAYVGTIAWTPILLETRGTDPLAAAAMASQIGWASLLSVAVGGWLAARSPIRDLPMVASFIGSALLVAGLSALAASQTPPWLM